MAMLEELDITQIKGVIGEAVEKQVPATITISLDISWVNYHTRVLAVTDQRVLLAMPIADDGVAPHEFCLGEKVGLSFKLKHHKYLSLLTVGGVDTLDVQDETPVPVLSVCWPVQMQRLQRRAYTRVEVPDHCIVRASFWLGSHHDEPAGTTPDRPVWIGQVRNISAGGFQLHAPPQTAEHLEVGYSVGVRLIFGTNGESVFVDAQIRHVALEDDGTSIGLQFIGLGQSSDGKAALQFIRRKVTEFQRCEAQAVHSCG